MRVDPGAPEGPPPLTMGQLHSFVSVVRWGKQAAAEAATGRSQSQISRDIAALEKALGGLVLFDRSTRQVTEAGRHAWDYANEVLGGWRRLRSKLLAESVAAGKATLAAEESCVEGAVLPFLSWLRKYRPELGVRLFAGPVDHARDSLLRGEADVAVLPMRAGARGLSLRQWLVGRVHVALSSSSPVARRGTIRPEALRGTPVIVPSEESPVFDALGAALKPRVLDSLTIQQPGASRNAALACVAAELGAALLMVFGETGDPLLRQLPGGVAARPLAGKTAIVPYGIAVRRGGTASAPALALIKELLRYARE